MQYNPEAEILDEMELEQPSLSNLSDEAITETISGLTGNLQSKSSQIGLATKYLDNEVCSIVTRIKYLQEGIKRNAVKAEQLKELIGLFEKYPEILRMLELMRSLGL